MNQDELAALADRIRAEVPDGALGIDAPFEPPPEAFDRPPDPGPPLKTFVEKLRPNPNWQALEGRLVEEAAALLWSLVAMDPQKGESHEAFMQRLELQRGMVRGFMRILDAPQVAHTAVIRARDRDR